MRLALALFLLVSTLACSHAIDTTIDDATITAAVKTALLNDRTIDGTRVDVRTEAGVVYLSGAVASTEEEARVQALVRAVPGVREVRSSDLSPTLRF